MNLSRPTCQEDCLGISFGSINTGLPPDIVKQLVEAERQPLKALEARKAKSQEQLKLVDDLTTKVRDIASGLRELGNTRGFSDIKIETGDPNVILATGEKGVAQKGNYMVEVEKLAHKTAAASNGFPDKDQTQVGVGYFKVKDANGNKREIYVDKNHNTLDGLAKLINSKSLGIQASVIQDRTDKDYPYRIMLSGKGIGQDGGVSFPTFYFLDGDQDFFLEKERPAENGRVKVDGFEFEITDNTLKDVIPGVTLQLRQAAPGKEIFVDVGEDKELIQGKVKKFVDGMNSVFSFIQQQNALDKDSDTTRTLGGDGLLRNIENRFRNILQSPVYAAKGSVKYLAETGISFARNGQLTFDEDKFKAVAGRDLEGLQEFFVGDSLTYGLIPEVKRAIGDMVDSSYGPLSQRSQGIKTKITQFDQQIANKERILAQKEIQLKSQFSRLEETMSKLKSQGQYLQAKLGGGGGGGFNLTEG
jgi:flagellar hook-associated protein 2